MAMTRRYTIHPPQLVGRLSPPRPGEDPHVSFRRLLGEWDAAMQELQRFLRYAMDANDSAQVGGGIVGVVSGEVSHPEVANRDVANAHPATAISHTPSGGIASANVGAAIVELDAEKVPTGRTVSTAAPLQGGGDLSANRSLTIDTFAGDAGAGGSRGVVPAPAAGDGAAGKFLQAAGGWGAAGGDRVQRGGVFIGPTGALAVVAWRPPYACTVLNVRGYRVGGTGATVNAQKNGASTHLSSDLSLSSAGTWMDGGAVQNQTYADGDYLELLLQGVSGSPSQVVIQVDFRRG